MMGKLRASADWRSIQLAQRTTKNYSEFRNSIVNATEPTTLDLFERIVRSRTSIRAFLPQPVPDAILQRAFAIAGRAPSNCNTQPWVTHVASGATRDRLAKTLIECAEQDRYSPDYPYLNEQYTPLYKQRQFEHGKQMFEAIGVARSCSMRLPVFSRSS